MIRWFRNIGIMILLLLAGRMSAQVPVLDSLCAGAERFYRVSGEMGSTYSWILTPPTGPDEILPSDADTLQMIWNYTPGIYTMKVIQHSLYACDADAVFGQVIIFDQPIVSAGPDDLICQGSPYQLLNASSEYTRSVLWSSNGDGSFDNDTTLFATYTPGPNDIIAGSVELSITGLGLGIDGTCDPSVSTMVLTIQPEVFADAGADATICEGSIYTVNDASVQFAFSMLWTHNGLGSLTNNTTISPTYVPALGETGIVTLWLTATSPSGGVCPDATDSLNITISQDIMPLFNAIGPLCQNTLAPDLPDSSFNNPPVTGTWMPPFIDTSVPGTVTYVFTPDAGQCSATYEMQITVTSEITPEFDSIGPLCQNASPPMLPNTSLNGVSGTWIPAIIDTSIPGTFNYVFTPDNTEPCALEFSMDITVDPEIIPAFDAIGPLCLNSLAPALPDTSLNGITGTWDPATINTSVAGIFNFEFTPLAGQCSPLYSMEIEVTDPLVPEFDPIGPLCMNSIAPALPDTSLNGIKGTWTPDTIDTSVPGLFNFDFSPDSGLCAAAFSMEIQINSLPVVFAGADQTINNGTSTTIADATASGPNPLTYSWSPDTLLIDPSVLNPTTVILHSTVTLTLTVTDMNGCENSDDITINITGDALAVNPVAAAQEICQGESTQFYASASGGSGVYSYNWTSNPPGFTSDQENPVLVPTDGTIYIIEVNDGYTTIQDTINMIVHPLPDFACPAYGPVCEGSNMIIFAEPGIFKYEEKVITEFDPISAGSYTFIYMETNEFGCSDSCEFVIEVNAAPVVYAGADQTIPSGTSTTIGDATASGNAPLIYSWSPAALLLDATVLNPTTVNLDTTTTFTFTVTDPTGCESSDEVIISVDTVTVDSLQAITGPDDLCLGHDASIPIKVNRFISVSSFKLTLSYNVDKLTCEGFTDLISNLDDGFTATIDTIAGVITLEWHSDVPVTFPSIQNILNLVFRTKEPGEGQLEWYTNATESYFYDIDGNPIPADFFAGTVVIYDPPEILLAPSLDVCIGQPVNIASVAYGGHPSYTYQWLYPNGLTYSDDPDFDSVIMANSGIYTLLVTDSLGCTDQKSISLNVFQNPVASFHGIDTLEVQPGYVLDAGSGLASYLWNTNETTESITIYSDGEYTVEMESEAGCYGIDSVYVLVSLRCFDIPNAFSPNGDGMNDVFMAKTICPITYFHMLIYNRWGEKLFESSDISNGWDGKKNGVACPGDSYVFVVNYIIEESPGVEKKNTATGILILVK